MKIFIVFGHHNSKTSFNASIRDTFINEAKKYHHEIDLNQGNDILDGMLKERRGWI